MKGIILAGGSGTRLYPITRGISKQLMPIYDKPMIYYPLTTLIQAGIKEILIINTPEESASFKRLLGDGSHLGIHIAYAIQPSPDGLAQAFLIGRDFIGDDSVALVLGDNIFDGASFTETIADAEHSSGGTVFAYEVTDPERYGVVEFDQNLDVISIAEKPEKPRSNYAVVGLYFFDNDVISIAEEIRPSSRGELEITDVNRAYLNRGQLRVRRLDRGDVWLDTGTIDSMTEASQYVEVMQKRTGIVIGSPEVAAFRSGFISSEELVRIAEPLQKSGYGRYLLAAAQNS